jgi:regulator of nonsense transcripts 2
LKKNTAFIKRARTAINPAGVATFLQEIRTLSLHKYLTEIVSACFEGMCRLKTPAEIAAGVEVISALHQRFGPEEFTCYLGWLVGRGLSTPDRAQLKALAADVREREEKDRISRQRVLLRVATELWLVGVLKSLEDVTKPEEAGRVAKGTEMAPKAKGNGRRDDMGDAEPFPLEVLKDMLSHDREHVNLPLVVLFVKTFAWDVLGSTSSKKESRQVVAENGATSAATETNGYRETPASTDDDESTVQDSPLTSAALQQRFRNVLEQYFEDVKGHIIRDQKNLTAQGRRNAEAYVKSGEVFEDRQANHDKALKSQEKLIASAQTLAEVLGAEMPDLSEKEAVGSAFESGIGLVKTGEYLRGQSEGAGIWEDEDERRFYESLVDLKDRVPTILLEDAKKKKTDADEQVGKKVDESADAKTDAKDNDDSSTAIANKTVGAQVDAVLARLHELATRDQVDQLAYDFCFLNSKASRNRLIKAIEEIPKGRTDLLPLYARLVATLGRYLTDIPQALTGYLDDEFRSLQRRKSKDFLGQVRMVNIRYIAELTKFGVVPEHVIFHCLKVSLDDFSRMNIEIIASLLENCGRYLLRNQETSPRMTSFLETLQRKKAAQHLGQQERMLIENAIYYVNPPERAAIQQKERTTLDLYIRKLVYLDLNKKSLEKVIKQLRKLHWEEDEVVEYLRKIFIKPGKIKFSNIYLLAVMLGALHRHHTDFAISVLDEVLERVVVGLETNDFKYNQRRIAEVKYLGELYIYRMVDSSLIFDTLYQILNYGHDGYAQPDKICPIDLPDDYFRIRLVCSLLETCGMYFEKGVAKKKLDFFLSYLQFYANVKDTPPMDIDFVVQDTYSLLRPQWKLITGNLNEASKAFSDACKTNYQDAAMGKSAEPEEPEDLDGEGPGSDDARPIGDGFDDTNGAEEDGSGEDDGHEPVENGHPSADSDEEEHIVVTRREEQRDPEADADFDRELAKMMADSVESRKFERKPMFDVPLPMRRTVPQAVHLVAEDSGNDSRPQSPADGAGKMKFALLSKKGNRQQVCWKSVD